MEVSTQESDNINEQLKNQMFEYLANTNDLIPINQQRDDPDLNPAQKIDIFKKLLNKSPIQFLTRFGQYLLPKHLEYFSSFQSEPSYSIDFLIKQFQKKHKTSSKVTLRNKRFQALSKMIKHGNYFSDSEMRKRNPFMYEQLIEKFMTSDEIRNLKEKNFKETQSLIDVVLKQVENEQIEELKNIQKSEFLSEEIETSDEDVDDHDNGEVDSGNEEISSTHQTLNDTERELLKEEFRSYMYNQFIIGNDKEFDYREIDDNQEIEEDVIENQDREDNYFDSETPNNFSPQNCSGVEEDDELDIYIKSLNSDHDKKDVI